MAPIPVCMCGKVASLAAEFSKQMMPEYEVVFHFQSTDQVHKHLPALLNGEHITAPSGIGTNATENSFKLPQAMIVGGGFQEDEVQELLAIPEGKVIPWLVPSSGNGGKRPKVSEEEGGLWKVGLRWMMPMIVKTTKDKLRENGLVEGKKDVKVGVWTY